jgi:four helix bundle protein
MIVDGRSLIVGPSYNYLSMQKTNFENLRIYRLAEDLADNIWEIVVDWDPFAKDTVGKQVVRSADSVGANIAEGVGRWGLQDQIRFIYIARGSVNETKHWLRRAFKRQLLTDEQIKLIKPILEELPPKQNAYANSLKRRKGANALNQLSTIKDQPSSVHDQPSTIDDQPSTI